jgi:hypothetical protein
MVQMVENSGMTFFRFPGGSTSDTSHFTAPFIGNAATTPNFATFINDVGGTGLATIDYGSGSPQEGAAELAYLNAPVGSTTPIGVGQKWNPSANAWQPANWQTAGYWASLRASSPLAVDDGLNFLRIDHPAPFGIHYFVVGNELYGGWEPDYHGLGGGHRATPRPRHLYRVRQAVRRLRGAN